MNFDLSSINFSFKYKWEESVFLVPALLEVYQMFLNSSSKISSDGYIAHDGVYENCTKYPTSQEVTDYVFMALALILLIISSFFVKRTSFGKGFLNGRPGLLLPMGMLDSHDNIIEFTLAFLSVSDDIYTFIFGFKSEFGKQIPIVKFFLKLIIVFLLSMSSYVTFAGLQNKFLVGYIFGATISACYSFGDVLSSVTMCKCLTGTKIIAFLFSAAIFSSIDILLLFIFLYKIIKHVFKSGFKMNRKKLAISSDRKFCFRYVQTLLKSKKKNEEMSKEGINEECLDLFKCNELKGRIIEKVYKEIPGFSIPPRLIIGISVGSFFAYRIFIDQIYSMTPTTWNFINTINMKYATTNTSLRNAFRTITEYSPSYTNADVKNSYRYLTFFYVHLFIGCALSAIVFGFINSMIHSFLILRNYRLNFNKITKKGFTSMISLDRAPQPYGLILGFVKFSGYQAAHILWGILVVFFTITILLYFLIGFFLLPLLYVKDSWSKRFLINYVPVILASIILNFIQTLLVKYVFVKERGEKMEINNRRAFIIFCHCSFFLNAMMGIFTAIKKVIVWVFTGIICFCRIDFSSLPEYLQGYDTGYMCYIGFIYTEQFHHNPILRYFVSSLIEPRKNLKNGTDNQSTTSLETNFEFGKISIVNLKYRNKWRVAYTLLKNQSLLLERKNFLNNAINL